MRLSRLRRRRPSPDGSRAGPGGAQAALVGSPAPAVAGVDPAGGRVEVTWPAEGVDVVAFLTVSCVTCRPFWDGLAATVGDPPLLPGAPRVVVVTPGPELESRRAVAARAPAGLAVVMDGAAWWRWGAVGAPWFAVVAGGIVRAEGHAPDWSALERLVAAAGGSTETG